MFAYDPQFAAALAAFAGDGPVPPPPPIGDVESRRAALNAMLEAANNVAQPIASDVEITEHTVLAQDGTELRARWYRLPTTALGGAAVLYLHGGGMILGSVPMFDGPVSRYVARSGVPMLSIDYRLAPNIPTRPRSRTPTPDWSGSPPTPRNWASILRASRSWATARAVGSPPRWRFSVATAVARRSRISC